MEYYVAAGEEQEAEMVGRSAKQLLFKYPDPNEVIE